MASDDLDRLRAMVEAMTAEPWRAEADSREPCTGWAWTVVGDTYVTGGAGGNDASAIAALRNVAPELLAVAEAADEDLESGVASCLCERDITCTRCALLAAVDALRAKLREVV